MAPTKQASSLAGLIGRAATSAAFRREFLANPVGVGKQYALPADQIAALQKLDAKVLANALNGIGLDVGMAGKHSSTHSSAEGP
jgi:hypothetical protein